MLTLEERTAPKGQFRAVGVDTFANEDWVYKDFATREEAAIFAVQHTAGKQMFKVYIYDDTGTFVMESGTF